MAKGWKKPWLLRDADAKPGNHRQSQAKSENRQEPVYWLANEILTQWQIVWPFSQIWKLSMRANCAFR